MRGADPAALDAPSLVVAGVSKSFGARRAVDDVNVAVGLLADPPVLLLDEPLEQAFVGFLQAKGRWCAA